MDMDMDTYQVYYVYIHAIYTTQRKVCFTAQPRAQTMKLEPQTPIPNP
jgi:hypothetical protein